MKVPELGEKELSILAVSLALFGLAALYFYPSVSGYESLPPSLVKIAEDGKRVRVDGVVASIAQKDGSSGTSIKLCGGSKGDAGEAECVSISVPSNAEVDYPVLKGDRISAYGAASTYSYAKFVRAEKIRHAAAQGDT